MLPPFWGALSEWSYGRCLSHHPGTVRLSLHGQNVLESDLTEGSLQLSSAAFSEQELAAGCSVLPSGTPGLLLCPYPGWFAASWISCLPGDLYPLQAPVSKCRSNAGGFAHVMKQGWKGFGKPAGSTLRLRQVQARRCRHGGTSLQDRGALAGDRSPGPPEGIWC